MSVTPPIFVFNYYDELGLNIFESLQEAESGLDPKLVREKQYKILDYKNDPLVASLTDDSSQVKITQDNPRNRVEDELLGRLYTYLHAVYQSRNEELKYRDKTLDETIELVREVQAGN